MLYFMGAARPELRFCWRSRRLGSQPEAAPQHAGQPLHPIQRVDRGERRGAALLLLRFRLPPHRFQV